MVSGRNKAHNGLNILRWPYFTTKAINSKKFTQQTIEMKLVITRFTLLITVFLMRLFT